MPARETPCPARTGPSLASAWRERLKRLGERCNVGAATVARASIGRGLPLRADAMRKAVQAAGSRGGRGASFDTLSAARDMEAAGLDHKAAEAVAGAIRRGPGEPAARDDPAAVPAAAFRP